MKGRSSRSATDRPGGVVLVIVLLTLVILTAIGVSGMSASSVHLNLARNTHMKHESFQRAESAALAAEAAWDGKLSRCLNAPGDCAEDVAPPVVEDVRGVDWDAVPEEYTTGYGEFVVEYIGWRPVPGDDQVFLRFYRVTARGQSRDGSASTLIQTVYRICTKADGTTCDDQGGD